jgi:hypothetical protein
MTMKNAGFAAVLLLVATASFAGESAYRVRSTTVAEFASGSVISLSASTRPSSSENH